MMWLSSKHRKVLLSLGETILGVPAVELGDSFVSEVESFVENLDEFLRKDIKILISLINSRFSVLTTIWRFSPFTSLGLEMRQSYLLRWATSRIPQKRTAYTALKAICGWGYYSDERSWFELNYPGKTIGREEITPTLLFKSGVSE